MPVDPQLAPMLDAINAAGFAPGPGTEPTQLRAMMRAMALPSDIVLDLVEDRTIPGPGGDIPVRVYQPGGASPMPVVVYFHGGGWVIGDLDTHDAQCRTIAAGAACIVVSVDYRLAPEHVFPAAVDDAFAAARWVAEHAGELGGDPGRLALAGDSAGGHLAAVTAIACRDAGIPVAFQMLVYPAIEYEFESQSMHDNADGYLLGRESMRWFYGHFLERPEQGTDWRVSPRQTDLRALPPALVVTAELDPLRDQGRAYADALRAAGNEVEYREHAGLVHGFFGMTGISDAARLAVEESIASLRRALGVRVEA